MLLEGEALMSGVTVLRLRAGHGFVRSRLRTCTWGRHFRYLRTKMGQSISRGDAENAEESARRLPGLSRTYAGGRLAMGPGPAVIPAPCLLRLCTPILFVFLP